MDAAEALPSVPLTALLQQAHDAPAEASPGRAAEGAAADLRRQGFRVGPLHLMVRDEDGSELTELPALHRLPNAPGWFAGVANRHGALVPVFDAAVLLGVERLAGTRRLLLVLCHGDQAAGLLIDGLPRRLKVPVAGRLADAPEPAALAGCVRDTYCTEGADWLDLDPAALFGRLEASLAA